MRVLVLLIALAALAADAQVDLKKVNQVWILYPQKKNGGVFCSPGPGRTVAVLYGESAALAHFDNLPRDKVSFVKMEERALMYYMQGDTFILAVPPDEAKLCGRK